MKLPLHIREIACNDHFSLEEGHYKSSSIILSREFLVNSIIKNITILLSEVHPLMHKFNNNAYNHGGGVFTKVAQEY